MKRAVSVITIVVITVTLLLVFLVSCNKQRTNSVQSNAEGQEESKAVSSEALGDVAEEKESTEEKEVTDEGESTQRDVMAKTDKVLIVYFSLTGNTHKVANIMKEFTGGDVFEIQPDFDYSMVQSRKEMEDLGLKQVEEGFRPGLLNSVENIDSYDLIIVGSPVWWYSVTPPVMSFLDTYDLAGKKVAPFCTCGSVAGDFFTQFEEAVPDADIQEGLILTEGEISVDKAVEETIWEWLENLGID